MIVEVDPLSDRVEAFEQWMKTVRNPAKANSEGVRELSTTNRKATVWYEVAPLLDETWAIRISCEYHCGDYSGHSLPWTQQES